MKKVQLKYPFRSHFLTTLSSLLLVLMLGIFQVGCSSPKSGSSNNALGGSCNQDDRVSTDYDGVTQQAYCSTVRTYSGVTITGTANYYARLIDTSLVSPTVGLLGAGSATPIRYAEVRVTDASGTEIQCGETDGSGAFSLDLPGGGATYTISVNSRANNSNVKAYVLNCPEENSHYSISTSVVTDSSKSVGTIEAGVSGEVIGGAFNIMDQILKANEYLRSKVGSCAFTGCVPFTVAPKVDVYWDLGFNPGHYFGGSTAGTTSFYTPTSNRLFILGGKNGDINTADTDHFDNSVILHEYGHFLESNISKSDSPGGSHNGARVIDPRLAWSEGFANFFQAAVLDVPRYIDTYGNIDGSTGEYFRADLEDQTGTYIDKPKGAGEGNFREFSVTRMLWDAIDSTNTDDPSGETVQDTFDEFWTAFTSASGFKKSNLSFRSVGFINNFQANMGATDWTDILTDAQQTTTHYAEYRTAGGSCAATSITPSSLSGDDSVADTGSLSTSHLQLNNDFYFYKHTGGTMTTVLTYSTPSGINAETDLDLFVYRYDGTNYMARYGVSSDIANNLNNDEGLTLPDGNLSTAETETVSQALPAGDYLINVQLYTGNSDNGNTVEYTITINGNQLCPATLP